MPKRPPECTVVVRAASIRTPRMLMHRCTPRTATATSSRPITPVMYSATCRVKRSWTWRRPAKCWAIRPNFDRPTTSPSGTYPAVTCKFMGSMWCSQSDHTLMPPTMTS